MVWYLEWVCKILNSTQYTWIELKCLFIWLRAFCSSHSLSWTELNWFSWVALLCSLPIFLVGCLRNLSKTYLKKSLLFLKSFVASYSLQHQVLFLSCIPNLANFAPSLYIQLSSVQLLSCVQLFATPWIAAHQASLSITNSQSLLKLMPIESLMPSNHLILCPSPPAFNLSQRQCLFRWVSSSHQVAIVLELQFQHQSFQWIFRTDFL